MSEFLSDYLDYDRRSLRFSAYLYQVGEFVSERVVSIIYPVQILNNAVLRFDSLMYKNSSHLNEHQIVVDNSFLICTAVFD